ncbi:MAG: cation:dicarboxylate symporter family transporter, partial [Pseudomonadota bacterium]
EGLALVAGIDRILDMARTTVNITGDSACAVVIAASENGLERNAGVAKTA